MSVKKQLLWLGAFVGYAIAVTAIALLLTSALANALKAEDSSSGGEIFLIDESSPESLMAFMKRFPIPGVEPRSWKDLESNPLPSLTITPEIRANAEATCLMVAQANDRKPPISAIGVLISQDGSLALVCQWQIPEEDARRTLPDIIRPYFPNVRYLGKFGSVHKLSLSGGSET